ncbi:MAG TPA: winged helix-turn-helix domain-containing protein [Candidatus Bathyarchaeia archaeon]|nr:winged helix-turn-helix domain-containing protein [Candidatus Bathyarchaeia archaeon]
MPPSPREEAVDHFQLGPWLIRPSLNTAVRNGTTNRLTPKAMAVLLCLAEHAGEPVPKEKLLEEVWPETFVSDDVLKGSIAEIRRVLEDDARDPRIIETIAKRGYRLIAPVEWIDVQQQAPPAQLKPGANEVAAAPSRRSWVPWAVVVVVVVLIALAAIFDVGELRSRLRSSAAPQIRSLAVLPLQNLSDDPSQEYFSEGMTDSLITDLAQIGSLKVISRTSSIQYKQTSKSLPEVARELNVDGIVEGTVQRSGDRVRINVQLIQGASDKHLWAKSYERDLRDVFALERDVTDDIARQIQVKLTMPGRVRVRPVDTRVLDAYIRGNYFLNGRGTGGGDEQPKKARAYFQQAIDLDPNFVPAYIGLAQTHDVLSQGEPDDLILMRQFAEKAVALDPDSADALVELGSAKQEAWDWSGAETEFRRALALDPNNVQAHDLLGCTLDITGRLEGGWKELQIAQELDPNRDHIADTLYQRGNLDQAIEIRQRIAKRNPLDGYNRWELALSYALKGKYQEFVTETGTSLSLFGVPGVGPRLQRAYDESGPRGALRSLAGEFEHFAITKRAYFPGVLAQLYAALGDKDRAFYWLEQFRQHHDLALADPTIYFKTDPWFAPLRSDPRFGDFLRRAGLPQ